MKKIENAVIESTSLDVERVLTAWLYLDFGGSACGFGGYGLHHKRDSPMHSLCGWWIQRVLETVGVEKWEQLRGKHVRAETEGLGDGVTKIGHILALSLSERESQIASLTEQLAEARKELDQERVRLAACSVAALGWATGENDVKPGQYGHSASFDDVRALRAKWDAARAELKEAKEELLKWTSATEGTLKRAQNAEALAEKRKAWIEEQPHNAHCHLGVENLDACLNLLGKPCQGCTCGRDAALAPVREEKGEE